MDTTSNCKGCRESVRLSPDEIATLFRNTVQDVDLPLVTVEEYKIRIEHCRHCEALQYGTTCKYCGCIVDIKSKLQHAKCPYPYAPKW